MEFTEIIERFGITGAVLLWFMFRMEKRIDKLIEGFQDFIVVMKIMANTLDVDTEEEETQ